MPDGVIQMFKHGHNQQNSPTYVCWRSMRQRCSNPNVKRYPFYGGRGIKVCERWNSFVNFLADVGERPSPVHSIDRIDNNGHYEPGNVRWAENKTQQRNRTNYNRILVHDGRSQSLQAWADEVGLLPQTIRGRLAQGWAISEALTKPIDARRRRRLS